MNYNTLMNKPTINYKELIGDNTVNEVGGITEEQFNTLLTTDLASYYTKAQIDDLFSMSYVYREKSGSIVTFDCPASVNGIDKVVSEIVAVQAGTGDPSPTNVRPIIGWSAVNVYDDPVYGGNINWNQLMQISSRPTGTNNDVLITNNGDGSFTLNGTASGNIYADIYTNFQNSLTANHIYMFVANSTADTVRITNSYGGLNIVTSDKKIVKYTSGNVYVALYVNTGVVVDNVSAYPQCLDLTMIFGENKAEEILAMEQAETGSGVAYVSNLFPKTYYTYNAGTKTCVSAVNGDTYGLFTTTLKDGQGNPLTCYGGELVNENGVQTLVLTHGYIASYNGETLPSTWISDRDVYAEGTTPTTGAEVVYELATPQQIPQDSLSIATQEGVNNIWADSGDVTVKALDKILQG